MQLWNNSSDRPCRDDTLSDILFKAMIDFALAEIGTVEIAATIFTGESVFVEDSVTILDGLFELQADLLSIGLTSVPVLL